MFGYVTASWKELTAEEQKRYGAVYCGEIRQRSTGIGRICLSYDMAFLALLLMSLYEPEEESGKKACRLHSVKPRPWVDNEYIRYAADMNVALGPERGTRHLLRPVRLRRYAGRLGQVAAAAEKHGKRSRRPASGAVRLRHHHGHA